MAGYEQIAIENQQKINEKAAEKMADLHDEIKKTGYDGKDLENYLVRLVFCLFEKYQELVAPLVEVEKVKK